MISPMDKAQIITLYRNEVSIRSISKMLRKSRNTVRRYIEEYKRYEKELSFCKSEHDVALVQHMMLSDPKMNVGERKRTKFTGKLKDRFFELLKYDEERNQLLGTNKQKLNAAVLHRKLLKEGFEIGESTIRSEFAKYKNQHPEVFIRQDYDFGERCEFDFHQVKLEIDQEICVKHQATMSFPKSNHVIAYLYDNEKTDSVIDAIVRMIEDAGGVPKTIVFDNLKPVVQKFLYGSGKIYSKKALELSHYYGFEIVTCNPRKGNEKGHVENSGKTSRIENFSLDYRFIDEEDLKNSFENNLIDFNKKSENQWKIEQEHLMKKPPRPYINALFGQAVVNSYSVVSINSNFYSVKDSYVGKKVDYMVINNEVTILYDGEIIGLHKKVDGIRQYVLDINHYLDTFMKKPGALHHSLALKQSAKELQTIYTNNYISNPKEFIKFLLGDNYVDENSIEDISNNQLDQVSKTFGQA